HVNIVCLLDITYDHKKFYLVLEYAILAYQLLIGLAYCHDQNIIHRHYTILLYAIDIKPHNILVRGKGILKIADFAISKESHLKCYYSIVGDFILKRFRYRPHDILLGNTQYSFLANMWYYHL
ncbi:hypothetical protein MXB_5408, partial [Myxobolus squamalis]